MKLLKIKAFTLVELIVVITILAILATIGFVGYGKYITTARDGARIEAMKNIYQALKISSSKKNIPLPEDKIEIKAGTGANEKVIAYQGKIGKNIIEQIGYSAEGVDPKDGEYYSYYVTKSRSSIQIMALLEESPKFGMLNKTFADDYSDRFPKVWGDKLGILTNTENIAVEDIVNVKNDGYVNISETNDTYIAHVNNGAFLTGTGAELSILQTLTYMKGKFFACRQIQESGASKGDGIYKVYANGEIFNVLCDMTNDNGGWTLVDGVSARFGQIVGNPDEENPNINNYFLKTNRLYSVLNNLKHPIFKYKIDRNAENLEFNYQIDDVQGYLKAYKRNLTEGEDIKSISWITMNNGTIVQNKKTGNFTRITLRRNNGSEYYGHLKSYNQSGPHSWWVKDNGYLGQMYVNKSLLSVVPGNLPTFGGIFNWDEHSGPNGPSIYLVAAGETYATKGYEWHEFSSLKNKGIKAGLWLK